MSPRLRQVADNVRGRLAGLRGTRRADRSIRREPGLANAWRRFRRGTDRYRLLTDVVGALLIVGIVIGGIAAATGGVWPPVVVVESGSMMHAVQETPYGRFGTIDVGDMVFVRAVRGPADVTTWADGGEEHYGRPGDVIAYAPNGDFGKTAVIHRAIAYVEVVRVNGQPTYTLHWTDGEKLTWGPSGIYFPPLGFSEDWGFSQRAGFRPAYSGYITKGDNAFSNPAPDQAMPNATAPISRLVEPAWVIGKVYGEVPWIGLGKLALQSAQTNPEVPGWERIGNAYAPLELWTMCFLTLTIVVLVPLTIDTLRRWREHKLELETERRLEEEARKRAAARRAAVAQPKRVTTFAAVVSPRTRGQGPQGPSPARGRGP